MDTLDTLDDIFQENEMSENVISLSGKTAPWIKLVAIISSVTSILGLIATIYIGTGINMANIITTGVITAITIGLYLLLLFYGNSLSKFANSGRTSDFSDAMNKQKHYWIFIGIIMIIAIVFSLLLFVFVGAFYGDIMNGFMQQAF